MAAYVIADMEVLDSAGFQEYRKLVGPMVERYGGRYLVLSGNREVLEGRPSPGRLLAVIEFPSLARAKEWYQSQEYRKIISLRQKSTRSELTLVDGL